MEFSRDLRSEFLAGRVTVSVRLWRTPKVRAGSRYAVGGAQIEIDEIELLPFSAVTAEDVRRSGERDREALRRRVAHAGPITDQTLVYRLEFHVVA